MQKKKINSIIIVTRPAAGDAFFFGVFEVVNIQIQRKIGTKHTRGVHVTQNNTKNLNVNKSAKMKYKLAHCCQLSAHQSEAAVTKPHNRPLY